MSELTSKRTYVEPYVRNGNRVAGYWREVEPSSTRLLSHLDGKIWQGTWFGDDKEFVYMDDKPFLDFPDERGNAQVHWKALYFPDTDEWKFWIPSFQGPYHDDIVERLNRWNDSYMKFNGTGFNYADIHGWSGNFPQEDLFNTQKYVDMAQARVRRHKDMLETAQLLAEPVGAMSVEEWDAKWLGLDGKRTWVEPHIRGRSLVRGYWREVRPDAEHWQTDKFSGTFFGWEDTLVYVDDHPEIVDDSRKGPQIGWRALFFPDDEDVKLWVHGDRGPFHWDVEKRMEEEGVDLNLETSVRVSGQGSNPNDFYMDNNDIENFAYLYAEAHGDPYDTMLRAEAHDFMMGQIEQALRENAKTLREITEMATAGAPKSAKGRTWVDPYVRDGVSVEGYWRDVMDAHVPTLRTEIITGARELAGLRADLLTRNRLRELHDALPDIRSMPLKVLADSGWTVNGEPYNASTAVKYNMGRFVAGLSIDKLDYGDGKVKYGISGGFGNHIVVDEDKLEEAAVARISSERDEIAENWRKVYWGKLAIRGDYVRVIKRVEEAAAVNERNPKFVRLREWSGIPDYVAVVNDKGIKTRAYGDMDFLVTAFRDQEIPLTTMGGDWIDAGIGLREKGFNKPKPLAPGLSHASDADDKEANLLRHEWAHSLWSALGEERRKEFWDMLPKGNDGKPDPARIKDELTEYAADFADADEKKMQAYEKYGGPHAYVTETFSEAFSVVTNPDFNREDWQPWVGEIADWLDALPAKGTL